jgi:hypothetical protein
MQAFHLVFHTSFLYLKLRRFHVMLEKGKVWSLYELYPIWSKLKTSH